MKYLIIINDGKDAFHLGQNNLMSIQTRGIYYTLMSLPIEGKKSTFPLLDFLKKANISRGDFKQAMEDFQTVDLATIEKQGSHEYITVSNTELVRVNVKLELDENVHSFLFQLSEYVAHCFSGEYGLGANNNNTYSWFATLKKMHLKKGIDLATLQATILWYLKNKDDKYTPTIAMPNQFMLKWVNICEAKKRADKVTNKGFDYL